MVIKPMCVANLECLALQMLKMQSQLNIGAYRDGCEPNLDTSKVPEVLKVLTHIYTANLESLALIDAELQVFSGTTWG